MIMMSSEITNFIKTHSLFNLNTLEQKIVNNFQNLVFNLEKLLDKTIVINWVENTNNLASNSVYDKITYIKTRVLSVNEILDNIEVTIKTTNNLQITSTLYSFGVGINHNLFTPISSSLTLDYYVKLSSNSMIELKPYITNVEKYDEYETYLKNTNDFSSEKLEEIYSVFEPYNNHTLSEFKYRKLKQIICSK